MNKSDLTLVTALFDLGRGEMDTSFARSFDHYKECFSRLLKLNNFPMIIYCDPSLESFIWQYRSKDNTSLIFKTLDDLKNFPFFNEVQKIRTDPDWLNQAGWLAESTQARLELYNPLVMSKQFFLNDATLYNSFNTNYFLWIDAGISNTVNIEQYLNDSFEIKIKKYLNKMLYICFPYDGTVEVHGFDKQKLNEYAGEETKWVARGGIFGGSKHSINHINDIYYSILHDSIKNGYMGTEESIFTIITYKHKNKCNIHMIEGNGLVYKFFDDLNNIPVENISEFPLAFYSLTFNTPTEFKSHIESFINAYPDDFKKCKKYVVDNSTDENAKNEYRKLFKEYNYEIIHEGKNIGIQDGRQKVAEHFANSNHDYYIFFEEDFKLVSKDDEIQNIDGFVRYVPNIFDSMIEILDEHNLDYLRMTIIEFFGDNLYDWSFKNVPAYKREEFFPITEEKHNEDLRWKSKVTYLGNLKNRGISFAVGHFHYSNWPILFNKMGNQKVFLDIVYEHLYEQTIMSQAKMHMMDNKLKVGTLLAAPIFHERKEFYGKNERKENRHY